MRKITLLGASGSIGKQSIDVIANFKGHFELIAVSVNTNINYLLELIKAFPTIKYVCITDFASYNNLKDKLDNVEVYYGEDGLIKIATLPQINYVINALVGFIGFKPTLKAIEKGKNIGLANKETLVAGGHLIMNAVKKYKVNLYPIDSEHSAILQSLAGEKKTSIEKIIITASGGPFLRKTREELKNVTLEMALNHPNWKMGAKISIDSATMVNKGLEVIEAHWLFDLPYSKIDVIIHPSSLIHSMVQYHDGGIKAQLGSPDMRLPIMYALSYPKRFKLDSIKRLDFESIHKMEFIKWDDKRFPALKYAYEAGNKGGSLPTVYNGANEVAVAAFINGELAFDQIEDIIYQTMNAHTIINNPDLETIIKVDKWARSYTSQIVKGKN